MRIVLFACVHTPGRSQMAAAWFNEMADTAIARALGRARPADCVHPGVVEAMREVGIDLSRVKPALLTPALAAGAEWLVTMGCGDRAQRGNEAWRRISMPCAQHRDSTSSNRGPSPHGGQTG